MLADFQEVRAYNAAAVCPAALRVLVARRENHKKGVDPTPRARIMRVPWPVRPCRFCSLKIWIK